MEKITVLSLGWGVQSFTLAAMSALGELPKVDLAIHADTTHERKATYKFAQKWRPWLEQHNLPVITSIPTHPNLIEWKMVMIPAWVDGGKGGQQYRICTKEWKINPIYATIRTALATHNLPKRAGVCEIWLGISLDEIERVRPEKVKYIVRRWPLIEQRKTRHDCLLWLEKHNLEIPPKSACTFCPYRDNRTWQMIQQENNHDWQQAINADETIRKARPPYDLYLHHSLKPLVQVDFRSKAEKSGQLSLFQNECTGYCGV